MNKEYYIKYLQTKMALSYMIGQFYEYYISTEEAEKYGIEYDESDFVFNDKVECYFHKFENAGEYAWEVLEFNKPIISQDELFNKQNEIRQELLELTQPAKTKRKK